jgi:hypothetical protein
MRRFLLSPALLPAIAAAAIVLVGLPFLPGTGPKTSALWKGYHVLLLRGTGAEQGSALEALGRALPGMLCVRTALVSYTDFEGGASCTLLQLPARLDPADPRYDGHLRGLGGYFSLHHHPGTAVAYLPAARAGGMTARQVGRALGNSVPFSLVEHDLLVKALVLCWAFTLALAASLFVQRGSRSRGVFPLLLAPACMLCWTPFLLSGSLADVCFVGGVFPAWVRLAAGPRRFDRLLPRRGAGRGNAGPAAQFAAAVAIGLAALMLVAGFSWFRLTGALAGTGCSLLLLVCRPLLARRRSIRLKRRVFPVSPIPWMRAAALRLPAAALVAVATAPALLALLVLLRTPALPVPFPVPGEREFTWRSLSTLAHAGRGSPGASLPDMADAVTHAAFQQALVFGRPWGLPGADTRVAVTEYVEDRAAGSITARKRTVKSLDGAWLQGVTRAPPAPSVEQLLLSQGRPVRVRVSRNLPGLLRDLVAAVLCAAALMGWWGLGDSLRHLIRVRVWRFTTPTGSKHGR